LSSLPMITAPLAPKRIPHRKIAREARRGRA
jgi:hypothetical protein